MATAQTTQTETRAGPPSLWIRRASGQHLLARFPTRALAVAEARSLHIEGFTYKNTVPEDLFAQDEEWFVGSDGFHQMILFTGHGIPPEPLHLGRRPIVNILLDAADLQAYITKQLHSPKDLTLIPTEMESVFTGTCQT